MLKRLSALAVFALVAGCTGSDSFKPNAIISDVEPNRGAAGRSLQVEIHGDFTKWKDSSLIETDVTFGEGITVETLTVANEGFLLADIVIAPSALLGPRDVEVDGEEALGVFEVVAPFTIPDPVFAGGYAYVTFIGEGTDWLDGITAVSFASEDVVLYGIDVAAPNLLIALVQVDLFAAAGGIDATVTGVTTSDTGAGALAIATVEPIVLSASANANGTVAGNGLYVLRIPAGAIGDSSEITFPSAGTNDDVDVLVFDQDDGLNPIGDPDTDETFARLAFGNGDKDIYVTIQDYYLEPDEIPWEYDFVKTSLNPTQLANQATAQTIPAASAQRWYYFTGTKWNLNTATVTPTAAVPTIDPVLTLTRDGVHELVSMNAQIVALPETLVSLNGTRNNAFLTVEDSGTASGADTEFTVEFAQAALGGTLTESGDVDVAIPDNSSITSTVDPDTGFTTVSAIHLALDIGHTYRGDLVIELTSPSQITETVVLNAGGSTNGWLTVFPDLTAEDGDFTAFATETNPDGIWTLTVEDTATGDAGTLYGWALSIEE